MNIVHLQFCDWYHLNMIYTKEEFLYVLYVIDYI